MNSRLRIALISPKGPLYRHRGGIFGRALRYKPLTLTTLAALVPSELNAQIELVDEGIQDVPLDIDADVRAYPPTDYAGIVVIRLPDDAVVATIVSTIERFLNQGELVAKIPGHLVILERDRARFRPALTH